MRPGRSAFHRAQGRVRLLERDQYVELAQGDCIALRAAFRTASAISAARPGTLLAVAATPAADIVESTIVCAPVAAASDQQCQPPLSHHASGRRGLTVHAINPFPGKNHHDDTAENLWFMTANLQVCLKQTDNAEGMSIIEHRMAKDFGPPLHVHHHEAKPSTSLKDGFVFSVMARSSKPASGTRSCGQGDRAQLPRDLAYGRFLTITRGDFEKMVRAASRPAENEGLPEQLPPPSNSRNRCRGSAARTASICSAHPLPEHLLGTVRGPFRSRTAYNRHCTAGLP